METWKTRMNLAFPTFPQGPLPEKRNGTRESKPQPKGGRSVDRHQRQEPRPSPHSFLLAPHHSSS